jgi:hypothetical protein
MSSAPLYYKLYTNSFVFYGVGETPIIAIVCAAAYHEPDNIAAPCDEANNPPATGPTADNPAKPKMNGEPIETPNITIGVQMTADKNPIICIIYLFIFNTFIVYTMYPTSI